jgi:hypothetical protein
LRTSACSQCADVRGVVQIVVDEREAAGVVLGLAAGVVGEQTRAARCHLAEEGKQGLHSNGHPAHLSLCRLLSIYRIIEYE